jgi:hypothetical protein
MSQSYRVAQHPVTQTVSPSNTTYLDPFFSNLRYDWQSFLNDLGQAADVVMIRKSKV